MIRWIDANAQVAVTYSQDLTWDDNESFLAWFEALDHLPNGEIDHSELGGEG